MEITIQEMAASLDAGGYMQVTMKWVSRVTLRAKEDRVFRGILERYGGYLNLSPKNGDYYLNLVGPVCGDFLRDVLPYLSKARPAADLMLEFDRYMTQKPKRKPFSRLSEEEVRDRMAIRNRLLKVYGWNGYDVDKMIAEMRQKEAQRQELKALRKAVRQAEREKQKGVKQPKERVRAPDTMLERWPEDEVRQRLREIVFAGQGLQYADMVSHIMAAFSIGQSNAKRLAKEILSAGIVVKGGKHRSGYASYQYNEVDDVLREMDRHQG